MVNDLDGGSSMKKGKTSFLWIISLAVALTVLQAGCQKAGEEGAAAGAIPGSASAALAQPRSATLAAGTTLKVRTTTTLSTDSHKAGDTFMTTLMEPLAQGAWVIAPEGATVEGRIVEADKGGRVEGVARLTIALDRLHTADGQTVDISTHSMTFQAKTTKTKDATKVAIGTGIGAAVGAIAGGGKGAAIGAGAGAGAGTAVVLSTRGAAAEIGSETPLSFELQSPVTVAKT
jgi:hypothetical protein